MKGKIESAHEELLKSRTVYQRYDRYLQRRWGIQRNVMNAYRSICQQEVNEVWENGTRKNKSKVDHLFAKWKHERKQTRSLAGNNGEWRNVQIGDEPLRRWQEARDMSNYQDIKALKFGGVTTTPDEDELLKLPPNFTTYDALKKEDIEVESEVLLTKIRWELRSQEERDGQPWDLKWEEEKALETNIYDRTEHTLDFTKARVTDMNTCRRVHMPQPANQEKEIILGNMKQRILEYTQSYIEESCNDRGFPSTKNLSSSEEGGMKSLTKRCRDGEILIQSTDKSKRLAAISKEAYATSMEPHVENDTPLTWDEQVKMERVLNGHTLQMSRILQIGEVWGTEHMKRVTSALRSKNALRPPLYGLAKDHKDPVQHELGSIPPQRPVCGAQESANGPLSDILSDIIDTITNEMDNEADVECHSTEDLLAGICAVNNE